MSQKVRVRFAPSPTGPLHIGGVRTALFNYLFAKKLGGDFILRIEDTDQTRFVEGAETYIIDSLEWLNIPFDEGPGKEGKYGPYRQSERKDIYQKYAEQLVTDGKAYYAFDTPEALSEERKKYEADGKTFIYNWHNREQLDNSLSLNDDQLQQKLKSGDPYTIRFKTPLKEAYSFNDIIRGEITIDTATLDDKVLFKSDGMPTYHLANIVDDHLMAISHVIRGEEWLPSLALHHLLYEAFGWEAPKFAHLSLILKPNGKGKLSKRDGDAGGFPVFPLQWQASLSEFYAGYREEGYLPEAVVNMLAFLGWNPGTEQEIFDLEDLIHSFSLDRVNKAGAKFDPEKSKWFQQQYFQHQSDEKIAQEFSTIIQNKGIQTSIDLTKLVGLIKNRVAFTSELWGESFFFFECPSSFDEKAVSKQVKEGTVELLIQTKNLLESLNDFSAAHISEVIKSWIQENNIGFGKVMAPLRLSLVGSLQGPDVFEIAALLGQKETVWRLDHAIATFKNK